MGTVIKFMAEEDRLIIKKVRKHVIHLCLNDHKTFPMDSRLKSSRCVGFSSSERS